LYKRKFILQKEKQLNSSFELFQGFSVINSPFYNNLNSNLILSIFIGYLLSLLISLFSISLSKISKASHE
jgi:hypothetical protein